MAIIRSFQVLKTLGKSELTEHGYIDDGAVGGEIVLTAKRVAQGEIPVKSGIIEVLGAESIVLSIKNLDDSGITWTTIPVVRGTNDAEIDDPGYDDGQSLDSTIQIGTFGASLAAGAEQFVRVDASCSPFGVMLRAKAPAQDLNLMTRVLYGVK